MLKTILETFQQHPWLLPVLGMFALLIYAFLKLWKEHKLAKKLQKEYEEKFPDSLYQGTFGLFSFSKPARTVFDPTPDAPLSFGYKSVWIAVKGTDVDAVKSILKTYYGPKTQFIPANFKTGYTAVINEHYGYILPPLNGWIIVWDNHFKDITDAKTRHVLSQLGSRFESVQFYGNHQGVNYGAFGLYNKQECIRAFSIADGQIHLNTGEKTPEEIQITREVYLHTADEAQIEYYRELDDLPVFGISENILKLSEAYSLSPLHLDRLQTRGTGFACKANP